MSGAIVQELFHFFLAFVVTLDCLASTELKVLAIVGSAALEY